jgi:Pup amidohydrolase
MGVETEYAIRCRNNATTSGAVLVFDRLASSLSHESPVASSFRNPYRLFLANGGCVSLETGAATGLKHAMLETATPECNSPRELLCYQIAMETLLSEVVSSTFSDQDAHLLKGSADAHGHTYGQHESYEMRIAKGANLAGWRLGLLLMLPVVIAYRTLAGLWFAIVWAMSQLIMHGALMMKKISASAIGMRSMPFEPEALADLPQRGSASASGSNRPRLSPIAVSICAAGLRVLHLPLAGLLWLNIFCFALRSQRRFASAFLASRCIIDGAGYLDKESRFWVSARASTINRIVGFGSYGRSSTMLRCDSWLRGLCVGPVWSLGNYFKLFKARQRVEIAIGDSGMCEQSQYVRLGATALVLDLVERTIPKVPVLQNPIDAIGRFSRDWMLLSSVPDRTGRQWHSMDIQHAYAAAVRQMLQSKSNVPIEAWRILDQWQTTLNQLHPTEDESNLPRNMLGRIDWLSKLWLLHQVNPDATWQSRKKIDLRYHELSQSGYHRRLNETLEIAPIIQPQDVARAKRTPPASSPATQRGYLIREFDDPDCHLRVDWTHAEFTFEDKKRRVHF